MLVDSINEEIELFMGISKKHMMGVKYRMIEQLDLQS